MSLGFGKVIGADIDQLTIQSESVPVVETCRSGTIGAARATSAYAGRAPHTIQFS
jgi:hypothetical protein